MHSERKRRFHKTYGTVPELVYGTDLKSVALYDELVGSNPTCPTKPNKDETMSRENIDMLQDMIRDKLADDEVVCDLIEDDEDFEHLMELISNAIVECAGVMLRRSLEEN